MRAQVQTVYVEFEGSISKSQLSKITGVSKVGKVADGWLLESTDDIDLRKIVAKFAQENNVLTLTLRKEEKTLEEVFKTLTNQ